MIAGANDPNLPIPKYQKEVLLEATIPRAHYLSKL